MSGNTFRDAVKDYIESWSKNNNLNIDIEIEKVVGYRFVGSLRKVDIVLHKNGKFLGIECKYKELLKNALSEKLAIIVEFKKEILRPYGLRMTKNDLMVSFCSRRRISYFY
jgi:hypothetical protein